MEKTRLMNETIQQKLTALRACLEEMGSAVVAYSGGVDSSLLLKVAHDTLGDQAMAAMVASPSQPERERAEAVALAEDIGASVVILQGHELEDPNYRANTPQRCYFCKGHYCDLLVDYAEGQGVEYVVDGSNVDDEGDYRPGTRAAREHGLRSPLQEAGLTKDDVRAAARELGLSNWDKPASACLASRVPYGTSITSDVLSRIERAEGVLHDLGLRQLRVRHHGDVARIEVPPDDFDEILEQREEIVRALRGFGYTYVTLDLAGFRSGSMNETL